MAFVPQEVQIMTSRWQKKADKTFMNVLAQSTVANGDIWPTYDRRSAKETLLIIYRHSSVEALLPCQLYISIQLERVKEMEYSW
jgi:hypothetical protein